MKRFLIFTLISCTMFLHAGAQTPKPFVLGETREIYSKQLGEKRILNIYLPEGYNKDSTYPVIYLLDGSANEDFIHITGLVQFYNMIQALPPAIVVGIANIDRKRDFTFPTTIAKDKKDYPTTGHSATFISFVEKELEPYVESQFKTNGMKMIIGQSLGGLVAAEILLKKPALFTHYIIISPSLWWDHESLLRSAQGLMSEATGAKKVYVSVGHEGDVMENDAKNLVWQLKSGNKNLDVRFVMLPDEDHLTILHESVYRAFKIPDFFK